MDNIPDAGAPPSAVKVNWRQVGPGVETSVRRAAAPAAAPAAPEKAAIQVHSRYAAAAACRRSQPPTFDSCRPPGRHQTRAATMANSRRRSA